MEFVEFPKIARYSRDCIVSEKIDGTNASVIIEPGPNPEPGWVALVGGMAIYAGSRNRFLHTGKSLDNFGFAGWVQDHAPDLVKLGPGRHYGEWWGKGIGRGYGLDEKRFSLFNTSRWSDPAERPACCHFVPVLMECPFDHSPMINGALRRLAENGSVAAPGFMRAEGIVIFHVAGNTFFKKTVERDEEWKGKQAA